MHFAFHICEVNEIRKNVTIYIIARPNTYPVVVAAHPSQPTQFAIGMTDGGVQIFEPLPSDGQWGRSSPLLINASTALLENVASEHLWNFVDDLSLWCILLV